MSYSEDELIKKTVEAFERTLSRVPSTRWPIRSHSFARYVYEDFSNEIIEAYNEIGKNRISTKRIVFAFHNPKRIWRIFHHIALSMAYSGTPVKLQREVILFFLKVLNGMKKDPFNSDGNNLWYKPEKAARIASKVDYNINVNDSKKVHRLAGILWSYCEALFFVFHGSGFEVHGSYHPKQILPNSLLIRTYFDFSPVLWPELPPSPYENLEIHAIYNPNVNVRFSEYGTIIEQQGSFVESLEGFYLTCNGESLKTELESVVEYFSTRLSDIAKIMCDWSTEDLVKRYIDLFWYQIKPMKDILNKDWKPRDVVYDKVIPRLENIDFQEKVAIDKFDILLDRLLARK